MSFLHSSWNISINLTDKWYIIRLKITYLKPYLYSEFLLCICDVIKWIRRPSWKYMHVNLANLARLIHNKISNNSFTKLSPSNFTKNQIISTTSGEAAFQWYKINVTNYKLIFCLDSFQSKFMFSVNELESIDLSERGDKHYIYVIRI